MSLTLPQCLVSHSKNPSPGNYYTFAKSTIDQCKIGTIETKQYTKQLTSITFSATDRFSFVCVKPRSTWLWTSSDKQWTVKPNRTLITGDASFRCIKSSATWHRGVALYSAPREDIRSTTSVNKINFSGIKLMSVRLLYMSHEPIKGDGTISFTCLTHVWYGYWNLQCWSELSTKEKSF